MGTHTGLSLGTGYTGHYRQALDMLGLGVVLSSVVLANARILPGIASNHLEGQGRRVKTPVLPSSIQYALSPILLPPPIPQQEHRNTLTVVTPPHPYWEWYHPQPPTPDSASYSSHSVSLYPGGAQGRYAPQFQGSLPMEPLGEGEYEDDIPTLQEGNTYRGPLDYEDDLLTLKEGSTYRGPLDYEDDLPTLKEGRTYRGPLEDGVIMFVLGPE